MRRAFPSWRGRRDGVEAMNAPFEVRPSDSSVRSTGTAARRRGGEAAELYTPPPPVCHPHPSGYWACTKTIHQSLQRSSLGLTPFWQKQRQFSIISITIYALHRNGKTLESFPSYFANLCAYHAATTAQRERKCFLL